MALTERFDSARSSFVLNATQLAVAHQEENAAAGESGRASNKVLPLFIPDDEDQNGDGVSARTQDTITIEPDSEPMLIDDTSTTPLTNELPTTSTRKRPRSVSPDLVSYEKEIPSETASSPSPVPTRASSTSSQRLAGPGRTPARVEQILSENTSGTGSRKAVQMVLDTTGASWNLKPGQEGLPRKRLHHAEISESSSGKSARANMRAHLAGFARGGTRILHEKEDEGDSDSSEDEEVSEMIEQMATDEGEERPRCSSPKKMYADADATELETGDEGKSSTDLVEETMAIDFSESEDDELSKQPNDTSRSAAAATAGSPNSVQASDDLASNTDVLLSSSSEVSGIRREVVRTAMKDSASLAFDLQRTTTAWRAYQEYKSSSKPEPPQLATRSSELDSADLGADDEKATATLARVLSKADFGLMEVVGQFNRGFIVARFSKIGREGVGATDDLFIIDQHAADEKYNFEMLQTTTRLDSQRLFT